MIRAIVRTGAVASLASWAALPRRVKLENANVTAAEVSYPPGVPRERDVRAHDELVLLLDDCRYQVTDSQTGAKQVRQRRSGEVVWHDKGEEAPVLVNLGSRPCRAGD